MSKKYKNDFEKIADENDSLKKELEKIKAKRFQAENDSEELKNQLKDRDKEQQSAQLMSATVTQYKSQLETKTQEVIQLTEENNKLKKEKRQLELQNEDLTNSLHQCQEEFSITKKELETNKQEKQSLQQQLAELKKNSCELANKQPESIPALQAFSFPLGFGSPISKTPFFGENSKAPSNLPKRPRAEIDLTQETNPSDNDDTNKKKVKLNIVSEGAEQSLINDTPVIQEISSDSPSAYLLTQDLQPESEKEKSEPSESAKPKKEETNQSEFSNKSKKEKLSVLQDGKFFPRFFPKDLQFNNNIKTVAPSAKKSTEPKRFKPSSAPPKKQKTKISEETAYAIGRRGELSAYELLKKYYIHRYDETLPLIDAKKTDKYKIKTKENETGFILEGYDKSGNLSLTLEIIWHNKNMPEDEDSGYHHDMQIRRIGGVKANKERYIEVKSTIKNYKSQVKLSGQEWLDLFLYKDNYRIYRIFNVGTGNVRIEKHKTYEELQKGILPVQEVTFSY